MPGPRFSGPAGALLGALLVSVLAQACAEQQRETPVPVGAPKVLLIIGDGMGDQQITIARNYLVGSGWRLTLDDLPFRGAAQVQTISANYRLLAGLQRERREGLNCRTDCG